MGLARTNDHSAPRTETDDRLSVHEVPFQRGCQPPMPERDKGFPCRGGRIKHVGHTWTASPRDGQVCALSQARLKGDDS